MLNGFREVPNHKLYRLDRFEDREAHKSVRFLAFIIIWSVVTIFYSFADEETQFFLGAILLVVALYVAFVSMVILIVTGKWPWEDKR